VNIDVGQVDIWKILKRCILIFKPDYVMSMSGRDFDIFRV